MTAHPPPVPPDQRSDKAKPAAVPKQSSQTRQQDRNLAEQDRQGAVKQNTTNKGYQQDR
jgi:hypothetical protein